MKQNSTKNMILSHLKDINAKIEQKSINNMKLSFEGPFKDKFAGRSPERILCLYFVRLVSHLPANNESSYLMKVFSWTSTITAEVDERE